MKKEFNLSEKEIWVDEPSEEFYFKSDVKEFIKLLKEKCVDDSGKKDFVLYDAWNKIDKLAGSRLSGETK
jgi:hypothetical protein